MLRYGKVFVVLGAAVLLSFCASSEKERMTQEFTTLLKEFEAKAIPLSKEAALAYFQATISGKEEDYKRAADLEVERSRIFADAFGQDPDFFRFYRSMQAYTTAIKPDDTRLLLSPKSDFFRYFEDPLGGSKTSGEPSSATHGQ